MVASEDVPKVDEVAPNNTPVPYSMVFLPKEVVVRANTMAGDSKRKVAMIEILPRTVGVATKPNGPANVRVENPQIYVKIDFDGGAKINSLYFFTDDGETTLNNEIQLYAVTITGKVLKLPSPIPAYAKIPIGIPPIIPAFGQETLKDLKVASLIVTVPAVAGNQPPEEDISIKLYLDVEEGGLCDTEVERLDFIGVQLRQPGQSGAVPVSKSEGVVRQ